MLYVASITLTICLNFKGIQSNQYVIMDHWFTVPVMLRMEMEKTTILFLLPPKLVVFWRDQCLQLC